MMATLVRMPEVLTGVTEAAIQTWLVQSGQAVEVGTPLAEIETDKAVVEYAAEVAGVVLRILVPEGNGVEIGAPIAVIGAEGEDPEDFLDAAAGSDENVVASPDAGDEPPAPPAPAPEVAAAPPSVAAPDAGDPVRRFATPLVRRLARERGVDLADLDGTGPNGRIVRRDLDALSPKHLPSAEPVAVQHTTTHDARIESDASAPEVEEIPLTGMRRAIARRLVESKSTVPHFYIEAECRVDKLLELRRQVNEQSSVRVSVNDFVLKAVAGALEDVPDANVTWGETVLRRHRDIDIAVAVAIDGGLVTPVLRNVNRLPITGIATQVAELAERARAGRLKQHELEGGAFSVSNLGMYGVSAFSAIINPPHAGILAVGAARRVPVVEGDSLAIGSVMTVTLSADHRAVDGAVGAQWLQAFVSRIENPLSTLL